MHRRVRGTLRLGARRENAGVVNNRRAGDTGSAPARRIDGGHRWTRWNPAWDLRWRGRGTLDRCAPWCTAACPV